MVLNSMGNVKKRQGILHQEKWLRTCSDLSPSDRSSQTQTLRTRLKQDPHPGGFGRDTPYPCVQWIFRFFFSFLSETIFGIRINSSLNISPVSSVHVTLTVIDQFPAGAWTPPTKSRGKCAWRAHAGCRLRHHRLGPGQAPASAQPPGVYAPAGWSRTAPAPDRLAPHHLIRIRRRPWTGAPSVVRRSRRGRCPRSWGMCSAVAWHGTRHRHRVPPVAAQCRADRSRGRTGWRAVLVDHLCCCPSVLGAPS